MGVCIKLEGIRYFKKKEFIWEVPNSVDFHMQDFDERLFIVYFREDRHFDT